MRSWTSVRVGLRGDIYGPEADAVIRLISDYRDARGLQLPWFFVRFYDENGPHLRIRSQGVGLSVEGICDACSMLTAIRDTLTITEGTYEPEIDRYGGSEVMAASEEFFHSSSCFAAEVMRRMPWDTETKLGVGLAASLVTLRAASSRTCPSGVNSGLPWMHPNAQWRDRNAKVYNRVSAEQERYCADIAGKFAPFWIDSCGQDPSFTALHIAARRLTRLLRARRLGTPVDKPACDSQTIMNSHVHMSANRLGIGRPVEVKMLYLISVVLARISWRTAKV